MALPLDGGSPLTLQMPAPDAAVLDRRAEIIAALRDMVPGEGVIEHEEELRPYETDGLTAYRQLPLAVVLPETTAQVSAVLKYCHEHGIKLVPRGAGTGLSGGALPLADAVTLGLSKFNRILDIDFENRCVVAQPGVTNLGLTQAGRARRLLLRTRPLEPDRLLHRRQRRRELRRRALPQIRPHHEQSPGPGNGSGRRHSAAARW